MIPCLFSLSINYGVMNELDFQDKGTLDKGTIDLFLYSALPCGLSIDIYPIPHPELFLSL